MSFTLGSVYKCSKWAGCCREMNAVSSPGKLFSYLINSTVQVWLVRRSSIYHMVNLWFSASSHCILPLHGSLRQGLHIYHVNCSLRQVTAYLPRQLFSVSSECIFAIVWLPASIKCIFGCVWFSPLRNCIFTMLISSASGNCIYRVHLPILKVLIYLFVVLVKRLAIGECIPGKLTKGKTNTGKLTQEKLTQGN